METRFHGTIEGVRNDYTKPTPLPLTADAARVRVAQLRAAYDLADRTLKTALAKDDGRADLNALAQRKHAAARELEEAGEVLKTAEVAEQAETAQRQRMRFEQVKAELKESRAKFAEHYREAALTLGRWYALRQEARELANALASRMGNGSCYYPPHLQEVLNDANAAPNPLPALRDAGLQEIQVAIHERTIHQLVPSEKKR